MEKEFVHKITDKRGDLVEFLKATELKEKKFGQIYFVTFRDMYTIRGNHYHKNITEWFGIVNGKLLYMLYNVKTEEFDFGILNSSNQKYARIMVEPYVVHTFVSLEANSSLLNYTNKPWKKEDKWEKVLIKSVM